MRLLIATGLYPPDIGGPATYTVFLEKRLPQEGVQLVVVPFTRFRSRSRLIRHFLYLSALIAKSKGCDAIYALDTVSVGIPALIASLLTGKPLMLRVPGDYAWEQGQQRFGVTETLDVYLSKKEHAFPVRFLAWLQYRVARHATHIVVPSNYMKGVVQAWGIDPRKITRIYSELKPLVVPETPSKDPDSFLITTAARLVPWKGVAALIDAVTGLRQKGLPVMLMIIGDGVCRPELEAQVRKLEAATFIRFTGSLPRAELGTALAASDVFVLNTSYEGLSHQLLEVMGLGIPVITTPVGGNVELLQDGSTGLMVPFNDTGALMEAIERVYHDRAFGAALAARAKESLAKFNEDTIVDEFMMLMRSLWKF